MAKPSISIPDELLDKFDDEIIQAKARNEISRKVDRSAVVRDLIRLWLQSRGVEIQPQNPDIVRTIVEGQSGDGDPLADMMDPWGEQSPDDDLGGGQL